MLATDQTSPPQRRELCRTLTELSLRPSEDERARWLELRRLGLGGSDVAAALGVNPYRGPVAVWLDKLGLAPERQVSEAARWGTLFESTILHEWAEREGLEVLRAGVLLQSIQHPYMLATPDAWLYETGSDESSPLGVVEIKYVPSHWQRSRWSDGEAPIEYELQVLHYLAVTGLEIGMIVPLFATGLGKPVYITATPETVELLRERERDFWSLVQTQTPPAVDALEETTAAIRSAYPVSEPELTIDVDSEIERLVHLRAAKKLHQQEIELEVETLENALRLRLGAAAAAVFPDGRELLSYRSVERRTVDLDGLRLEVPEIVERHQRVTSSRRWHFRDSGEARRHG